MKLPGTMGEYTGNVMYPNDDSAVWDVNRKRQSTHSNKCTPTQWFLLTVPTEPVPGKTVNNLTMNFGPQHPAAHGVLRLVMEISGEV